MNEDGSISKFYARLCDIFKDAFFSWWTLLWGKTGEKIFEVLTRTLCNQGHINWEGKGNYHSLDVLIGSYQTFKLNLEEAKHNKMRHKWTLLSKFKRLFQQRNENLRLLMRSMSKYHCSKIPWRDSLRRELIQLLKEL